MFPVEESICADPPAGFDLPFVVQAERVCACAQQSLSRSCLPDSPSYWEPNQPPFPSPHTLRQTGLRLGRSFPARIRTPSSGFPTWTGTSRGTGSSGAARAEGAQPCPGTGCRWDLGLLWLWSQRWGSQHHIRTPQVRGGGPHPMGMAQHGTPRSSNGHPKPCTSVPLPKEAETPREKWFC